jgi:hypothetical protein
MCVGGGQSQREMQRDRGEEILNLVMWELQKETREYS